MILPMIGDHYPLLYCCGWLVRGCAYDPLLLLVVVVACYPLVWLLLVACYGGLRLISSWTSSATAPTRQVLKRSNGMPPVLFSAAHVWTASKTVITSEKLIWCLSLRWYHHVLWPTVVKHASLSGRTWENRGEAYIHVGLWWSCMINNAWL